jgi:hypothetical protein
MPWHLGVGEQAARKVRGKEDVLGRLLMPRHSKVGVQAVREICKRNVFVPIRIHEREHAPVT